MRPANPYAELRALLDTTRRLDPVEMAELHLEQGYVDQALRIYDELVANHPSNDEFARRRAWLLRMSSVRARPIRATGTPAPPAPRPERTLRGVRSPVAPQEPSEASVSEGVAVVARLTIVRVG